MWHKFKIGMLKTYIFIWKSILIVYFNISGLLKQENHIVFQL